MASNTKSQSPKQEIISHSEKGEDVGVETDANAPGLRLDKHGLPLSPQPSGRKDDPLVNQLIPNQARPEF